MAKILIIFVLFGCVLAGGYRLKSSTLSSWVKVQCGGEHYRERQELIKQSQCGPPKDVFVTLKLHGHHEELSPDAVWVKRCKGSCYDGFECHPTKVRTRIIPIRIYDQSVQMEKCSTYEVEEHVECGCCERINCGENHVFNPPEYEVESI